MAGAKLPPRQKMIGLMYLVLLALLALNVSKDILIIKTDEKQKGVAHKPAHLYTYKNREN